MKTILVLTDFSRNANHAARIAAWFAEKLHTGIILWNCLPKVPVMPGYLGSTLVADILVGPEESQDLLKRTMRELNDFISSTVGDYKPRLSICYREGSLRQELGQQIEKVKAEMIVIGAASRDCNIDQVFTGSDTYKIIETANCPVLIVPPKSTIDQLHKIVFATDFDILDLQAIHYLYLLRDVFDFQIEVVHVTIDSEKDDAMIAKEIAFLAELAKYKKIISYKEIRGKEVTGRLNKISKQTRADLLAMTHHQYSFFKRLLTDSITKRELASLKIPLLLFPIKII